MYDQYGHEGDTESTGCGWLNVETQPERIASQPEDRGINRPEGGQRYDEEESRMEQECLSKIQMHEIARTARTPAAETRQTRDPHEEALRELQAGQEPSPSEDRATQESRWPDELVVELTRVGRPADKS
jgi:hypothetical protein